ncbi:hypothetical protein GQ55_9G554100 [Panicum hallii var. hallii]|uniref:Uncharacterized protein n=1 Tax=Panicum hallii var. hallii TaxID=1504633 RepID=A0A2T7CFD8_9POAL|nr:hypothetical protein GQ55_9G554100 [Panicum hallii var. hallii]
MLMPPLFAAPVPSTNSMQHRVPARRARAQAGSPRHQVEQHPAGQEVEPQGVGLRDGQGAGVRVQLRDDPGDGHVRVRGPRVRVDGDAEREQRRVQLRRAADGAHLRAQPRGLQPPRRRGEPGGVVPGHGGQPARGGHGGPARGRAAAAASAQPGAAGVPPRHRRRRAQAATDGADRAHARGRRVPLPHGAPLAAGVAADVDGDAAVAPVGERRGHRRLGQVDVEMRDQSCCKEGCQCVPN